MPTEPYRPDYATDVIAATFGILSHPFRVLMNRAAYHASFFATLADFPKYWRTGLSLNLARGVAAVSLQGFAKSQALAYFGENTATAKFAAWGAAGIAGATVATLVETVFVRTTTAGKGHAFPATRFNVPLVVSYLLRELGFSGVVVCKNDIPANAYYPALLTATWMTSSFHKFATWSATADILREMDVSPEQKGVKFRTPDFAKDGVMQTIRNIAHGNIYNHPSCAVPIKNPLTYAHFTRNFLSVACSPNMFVFRFLFLNAFNFVYGWGKEAAPEIKRHSGLAKHSLFNNNKKSIKQEIEPAPKLRRRERARAPAERGGICGASR